MIAVLHSSASFDDLTGSATSSPPPLAGEGQAGRAGKSSAAAGKPAIALKSSEFRKGREGGWRELERLVDTRRAPRRGCAHAR